MTSFPLKSADAMRLFAVPILAIAFAADASDPYGPATDHSIDTKSALVNGEWTNSIVGGLEPCMVAGEYCRAG